MTTIICTKDEILWDSQMTTGGRPQRLFPPKVQTRGDTIFACAGDVPACHDAITWWLSGANEKRAPKGDWELLVWKKGKQPRWYHTSDNLTGFDVHLPYMMGSGAYAAASAMKGGLTPEKAMQVAYEMDVYSSGPTNTMDVKAFFKSVKAAPTPDQTATRDTNGTRTRTRKRTARHSTQRHGTNAVRRPIQAWRYMLDTCGQLYNRWFSRSR